MREIQQRHRHACGHTAIAVITGVAYNTIRPLVEKRIRKCKFYRYWKQQQDPRIISIGANIRDMRSILSRYGYKLGRKRDFLPGMRSRDLKFDALVCLAHAESNHWAIWDHKARKMLCNGKKRYYYQLMYYYEIKKV